MIFVVWDDRVEGNFSWQRNTHLTVMPQITMFMCCVPTLCELQSTADSVHRGPSLKTKAADAQLWWGVMEIPPLPNASSLEGYASTTFSFFGLPRRAHADSLRNESRLAARTLYDTLFSLMWLSDVKKLVFFIAWYLGHKVVRKIALFAAVFEDNRPNLAGISN